MKLNRVGHFLLISFILCSFSLSIYSDEGMWVYNNLPKKILKEKYQFDVTDAWSDHLMKSSVRFNSGGSGSFISSTGLVLTNHHVGSGMLQKISTPEHDYYKDGFYARTQADERPAMDLELNQLVSIEDVTERVNTAVKPGMTAEQANTARKKAMGQIETESFEKTGLRSDVITLYNGGQYQLYRFKRYTDVRLVFAPEFGIAFFGGDPDNFEYPRYDLDMCIFRVYEDGKPAKIEHYLKWSEKGAIDGELIFVSGHPGSTSRMLTVAAFEFLRDLRIPYHLSYLLRQEVLLQQYSSLGEEQARRAKNLLFSIQNSRKVYDGRMKGLQEPSLMQAKQKTEYQLRAMVEKDPNLKELAGAWQKIAEAQVTARKNYIKRTLLEAGQGFNSVLFSIARTLVRMADEDLKPNDERLPEYRAPARPSLELQLYSDAPIYEDFEEVKLSDSLSRLVSIFGENHSLVRAVLQGQSPQARAAALIKGSTLKNPDVRRLLASGGKKAIDSSYDPLIMLAKLVDPAARKIRKTYEEKVTEVERQSYAQIAKALFAIHGTNQYPDATFTLRLSFGQVKGYTEDGKHVPSMTTIGGAFEHELKHSAKEPWKLPESWHLKKKDLDLSTPFDFVSTADIIGGNSGSPVVNRDGELVGLIFDGNIQSLISDYFYTDEQNRAISVHSSTMREAMQKIYGAEALVTEIGK
ncbi:MAG: S46 family peptidase [Deltaproteobacteria bacterium]|nr:S46 family peptidase [Deltaproteobacteria bacterium]